MLKTLLFVGFVCLLTAFLAALLIAHSSKTRLVRLRYDLTHRSSEHRALIDILASNPAEVSPTEVLDMQHSINGRGQTTYTEANRQATSAKDFGHIVLLGDSMAAMWSRNSDLLHDTRFLNRGIGGQGTLDVLARVEADAVDLQPAAVVLQVGTNDLLSMNGTVPMDVTHSNIRGILDILAVHRIPVILTTLPPADPYPDSLPKVRELNQWITQTSATRHLPLVDVYALLSQNGRYKPGVTHDNIHPSPAGYAIVKPALLNSLEHLPKATTPAQ